MSARQPAGSICRDQRGVVNLLVILFLLTSIAAVLGTVLVMSSSDIIDSSEQNDSVQALLVAESGLERAAGRMALGTACTALVPDGAVAFGGGNLALVSADWDLVNPAWCRVRVAATVGRSTRTVDGWFEGGGAIALEASAWNGNNNSVNSLTVANLTVGGPGRVLVVGVTVDTAAGSSVRFVRYAGQDLLPQRSAGNDPLTELWMLVNPPVGTGNVVVTLNGSDQIVAGALVFTGVDLTTPADVTPLPATTGNSNTASITITPVTDNAWIVDVVSVSGVAITMGGPAGRQQRWNMRLGNSVTGAGSTLGPVSPAGARTLQWTWNGNRRWAQVAIALRPGATPQLVRWSEVVQ